MYYDSDDQPLESFGIRYCRHVNRQNTARVAAINREHSRFNSNMNISTIKSTDMDLETLMHRKAEAEAKSLKSSF